MLYCSVPAAAVGNASGSLLLFSDWSISGCVMFGLVLQTLTTGYQDFLTFRPSSFFVEMVYMLVNFYRFPMQADKIKPLFC